MRGYGLPRNSDVQWPDVADLHAYGLRFNYTRPGKYGPKPAIRSAASRRWARRFWKRVARREGKASILLALSGKVW